MYTAQTIHFYAEQDDWENGCDPDFYQGSSYAYPMEGETVAEIVNALSNHALWRDATPDDYELDSCDEAGRIDLAGMVNADDHWTPASDADIAEWKQGKRKLFYATWTIYVRKVETVSLLEADE